jgi:TM2 domain-containing membrane protein YozV
VDEAEMVETTRKKSKVGPVLAALLGWIVPGLGHLVLRRWGRALAFLISVGGLAICGYWMRGNVFSPRSSDPFGTIGFLADAGSGVLYFLSRVFEAAGPNVAHAAGDYGTRFIAAAGIVNVLAALDVYEIASRRRS